MRELVTLGELSKRIGMDKSHLRKFVLELGIEPHRIRDPKAQNQKVLALTADEAARVEEERRRKGFDVGTKNKRNTAFSSVSGEFYIAQLDPTRYPERLKFGFSISLAQRLVEYRRSNPEARLVRTWPCKQIWEKAVMDALGGHMGCSRVEQTRELFDCVDIPGLLERGDALFQFFPNPSVQESDKLPEPVSQNSLDEDRHLSRASEVSAVDSGKALDDFPVIRAGSWPTDLSLRREDIYGEWGR